MEIKWRKKSKTKINNNNNNMEPEYRYVSSDLYPIVFEVPEQNGEEGMWKMVLECLEWKIEHWIFR